MSQFLSILDKLRSDGAITLLNLWGQQVSVVCCSLQCTCGMLYLYFMTSFVYCELTLDFKCACFFFTTETTAIFITFTSQTKMSVIVISLQQKLTWFVAKTFSGASAVC